LILSGLTRWTINTTSACGEAYSEKISEFNRHDPLKSGSETEEECRWKVWKACTDYPARLIRADGAQNFQNRLNEKNTPSKMNLRPFLAYVFTLNSQIK
jgi:hypothetical protein